MTIPPPYVVSRTSRKVMYYVLVEPFENKRGGISTREHDLSGTPDPRAALARNADRLRERERWAGERPSRAEIEVIAAARAKLDALAAAVAQMDGPRGSSPS